LQNRISTRTPQSAARSKFTHDFIPAQPDNSFAPAKPKLCKAALKFRKRLAQNPWDAFKCRIYEYFDKKKFTRMKG
jgi:hypothetical protein